MIASLLITVLLGLLGLFQLALAAGAPLGRFAWGGQHDVLPPRLRAGSLVAIAIYALIALVALDRGGRISLLPDAVAVVAMWVVFGYLVLATLLNALSRSKPERYAMTPVTIALAALSLPLALG
ncbi:hypothetical protein ACIBEJ_07395 [Nonomuraea sp. NPDC050790]|uniref:hypothetical protein n=1 Tax=Nonomuraea sp. NPDC050790 TaxID=3364371 RepID=UPI0037A73969